MTPQDAITELRAMQRQIIHGPTIFGDIANVIETLQTTLADLNTKVHSGYDFNADPDRVTMRVGMLLPNDKSLATAGAGLQPTEQATPRRCQH